MLSVGLQWSAGPMSVGHKVLPDQLEIDPETGRVKPIQAGYHEVALWSMNLALNARLGLLKWLDVRLRMPLRYVGVTARFLDSQGAPLPHYQSIHHRDETLVGVADPDLQFGFRPLSITGTQRWLLEFGGGISAPIGRIEPDPYKAGREGRPHQHIMFGSGTIDPMSFITVGYLHRQIQVYIHTTLRGAIVPNQYGFQAGLRFRTSLSVESSLGLKQWAFQIQGAFMHSEPSLWDGQVDPDSIGGRTDMLLGGSVFWRPTKQWQCALQLSVPINLKLLGGTLHQPLIIGLSLHYQFRIFPP